MLTFWNQIATSLLEEHLLYKGNRGLIDHGPAGKKNQRSTFKLGSIRDNHSSLY